MRGAWRLRRGGKGRRVAVHLTYPCRVVCFFWSWRIYERSQFRKRLGRGCWSKFSVVQPYDVRSVGSHAALGFLRKSALRLEGTHENWKLGDRLYSRGERFGC